MSRGPRRRGVLRTRSRKDAGSTPAASTTLKTYLGTEGIGVNGTLVGARRGGEEVDMASDVAVGSSFGDKYGPWALVTGASSGIGARRACLMRGKQEPEYLISRQSRC